MHRHKTYMYINFQLNRVCRSVIAVHSNVFAKNRRLQTTIGNFFEQKKTLKTNAFEACEYFFAMQESTMEIVLV